MCAERAVKYFKEFVEPQLAAGNNVLIAAHGNSLRSIIMYLDALTSQEVRIRGREGGDASSCLPFLGPGVGAVPGYRVGAIHGYPHAVCGQRREIHEEGLSCGPHRYRRLCPHTGEKRGNKGVQDGGLRASLRVWGFILKQSANGHKLKGQGTH